MRDDPITDYTRTLLNERSLGLCELCGHPATNIHHRLPRGMGGTRRAIHTVEWLLHLCGWGNSTGCHGAVESSRHVAYTNGWLLRQHQTPPTSPVWVYGRTWVILKPDGTYEPWGAQPGWQMERATPDTPGAQPVTPF